MESTNFEFTITGPDRDDALRQLIVNLQQQARQLATDRDRYAAWMVESRQEAERLRAEKEMLLSAMKTLWDAYIPDVTPDAAMNAEILHPAWTHIATCMVQYHG